MSTSSLDSTTTGNVRAMRRWADAVNRRDLSDASSLIAADVVDHHLPPTLPPGRDGVVMWCTLLCDALQMTIHVEDVVASGDRVAVRATITGRHVADFGGLAATGRTFTAQMMSIERFADGLLVERWENVDTAGIIDQLTS
ncbi:MAG: ester cyclase [Ilumatobacteraceae bacterium]|jgi:predicted ester cyclase|nr:ester cyclase [Ilumatobacteraceae bacterium]